MKVTLNFSQLTETVKRSLAIIGKRATDDNGNLLFKDITLSSLEEPILHDFFKDALVYARAMAAPCSMTVTEQAATLSFPSDDGAVKQAFEAYCVAYALYSWLSVTAPGLAKKYMDDANRLLAAIFAKQPPV